MNRIRLMWGSVLLALGLCVAVAGMIDLGCLLLFGESSTLYSGSGIRRLILVGTALTSEEIDLIGQLI